MQSLTGLTTSHSQERHVFNTILIDRRSIVVGLLDSNEDQQSISNVGRRFEGIPVIHYTLGANCSKTT